MFLAAAQALAEFTGSHLSAEDCLYPNLKDLREVSREIAFKVAQTAREAGLGRTLDDQSLRNAIDDFCWFPDYTKNFDPVRPAVRHREEDTPVLLPSEDVAWGF
jgi:malic enzyme